MTKPKQHVTHCRCGKAKVLAHGMCGVSHTLKRQDEEYFEGRREKVLELTGIVAGCGTPPGATNNPSAFTIAYREVVSFSDDLALSRMWCEAGPHACAGRASIRCEVARLWWQPGVQTVSHRDGGMDGSHLPWQAEFRCPRCQRIKRKRPKRKRSKVLSKARHR